MHRRRIILTLAVAGYLAVALLAGCSAQTRGKVLDFLFDREGAPPPTRRVRRDLLREIEELKRELAKEQAAGEAPKESAPVEQALLPAEEAKTWPEAAAILPKDTAKNIDWMQALEAGAIAPHPGIDPKAPEQAVLELDVDLAASGDKRNWVTFPHSAHTEWLTCGNCHPAIFPLKRGAGPTVVTMAKIRAGEYCGVCHGKVAFGVNACDRCHTVTKKQAEWHPSEEPRTPIERATTWDEAVKLLPVTQGMSDWVKALAQGVIAPRAGLDPKAKDEDVMDLDVELVPEAGEMFKVIFSHQVHTAWLGCANCHPGIFQMAKGADPITMEKVNAGGYCGVCHGKVAFPVDACGRCHRAMAGG